MIQCVSVEAGAKIMIAEKGAEGPGNDIVARIIMMFDLNVDQPRSTVT